MRNLQTFSVSSWTVDQKVKILHNKYVKFVKFYKI